MRSPVSPELRALLDQERVIPPVSATQRARAMARAQASLKSTTVAPVAAPFAAAPRTRWAAAAAAALVISAAVGAAAYNPFPVGPRCGGTSGGRLGAPGRRERTATFSARRGGPRAFFGAGAHRCPFRAVGSGRGPCGAAPLAAGARRGVARGLRIGAVDNRRAQASIQERSPRRGTRGLAREGAGRSRSNRRSAPRRGAFRARFPRSVLLPTVSQMPASGAAP